MTGSSPLTRGKHTCNGCSDLMRGIIPAHAGKTPSLPSRTSPTRDHPRSRGENQRPPRHEISRRGIIPAHAGKTPASSMTAPGLRDHPRSRGENDEFARVDPRAVGSSPLTRGKRSWLRPGIASGGIIPAHAGKTATFSVSRRTTRDHPRSRGENFILIPHYVLRVGSSPLTRGKQTT